MGELEKPFGQNGTSDGWAPDFRMKVEARRAALREELRGLPRPTGPWVLEIGCGHGHFLAAYAAAFPYQFCLGIDLRRGRLEKARRKVETARLHNAVFLAAEASELLQELPVGVRFARVFVLFPDPWPKRRHHKNRLISPPFLDRLGRRMAPGADLFFRTDHIPCFEEAQEVLAAHKGWVMAAENEAWPLECETVFQARAAHFRSLRAVKKSPSTP